MSTTLIHDVISLRASQLWHIRGCPTGCDTEIWLEAERTLHDGPAADIPSVSASAEPATESEVEFHLSPAQTEQKSIQAAKTKDAARAPQAPHHTEPRSQPAETGKPLWTRPHSS